MHLNLNISGFEGPLDLLLDLSRKQKVDITKISILELADQYLQYVEKNVENLKLSADYLVMASLLAYLKSKLLLPSEKEEVQEIQEDLTQRLIHYNAIKKLSKKIFELPREGLNFFNVKIKNEFVISNKIVPKVSLQDLMLKYSEIFKKKKSIKLLTDENNLFNLEDGLKWLDNILEFKEKNWLELFNFIPSRIFNIKKKRSAIISLLLASLSRVNEGKILINQKDHFQKIMVRMK
jgi:segregation and condensation protein A